MSRVPPIQSLSRTSVVLALVLVLTPGAAALSTSLGSLRVIGSTTYRAENLVTYSSLQLPESDGLEGRGIGIAVVSTGVDNSHPTFLGAFRQGGGRDFVVDPNPTTADCSRDPPDLDGAGTHAASVALGRGGAGVYRGVAPSATLVDVRVATSASGVTSAVIAAGIDWVVDRDAGRIAGCLADPPVRVILVPHAVPVSSVGDPAALAVARATEAGILVAAPSGDGRAGEAPVGSPGHAADTLTVGGVEHHGTPSRNEDRVLPGSGRSTTGKPDVVAPAGNVSAAAPWTVQSLPPPNATRWGTPVAAAHVAGLAAIAFEAMTLREVSATPEAVKAVVKASAQDLAPPGPDAASGAGYADGFRLALMLLNRPPTLSMDFAPFEPFSGETVRFDASGSRDPDADDRIVLYRWDWGDGSTPTETTAPLTGHAFRRAGTFTVRLTLTDAWGAASTGTMAVAVSSRPPPDMGTAPVARIAASKLQPVVGDEVRFDASASSDPDGDIDRYEWDFVHAPGGAFSIDARGEVATHVYRASGPVVAALRVWDRAGHRTDAQIELTVFPQPPAEPGPPVVKITHPRDGDRIAAGETTVFWTTVSGEPIRYVLRLDGEDIGTSSNAYGRVTLAPGAHTIAIRALDTQARQHIDSVRVRAVAVDRLSPTGAGPDEEGNNTTEPPEGPKDSPGPHAMVVLGASILVAWAVGRRARRR